MQFYNGSAIIITIHYLTIQQRTDEVLLQTSIQIVLIEHFSLTDLEYLKLFETVDLY